MSWKRHTIAIHDAQLPIKICRIKLSQCTWS